ncbi:hypothetical protein [Chlorobium sp.]
MIPISTMELKKKEGLARDSCPEGRKRCIIVYSLSLCGKQG